MSSSIKEVKIGFLRGVVILRRWINLFPSAEMIIKAKSYFATAFFMTRIPVFITNKKTTPKSGFFIGSEGRIPQVRFVPFASLRYRFSQINKTSPLATKSSSGAFLSARAVSGSNPCLYNQ